MTTIVYRDGIMAADTRAYSGASTPIGFKEKLHRLRDGTIIGASSTEPGQVEAFVRWMKENLDSEEANYQLPPGVDKFNLCALVVRPNGDVFFYNDSLMPSGPLRDEFHAIGSGEQYAIGALTCGATAEAAVLVASRHDAWTGGSISQMEWHDPNAKGAEEPKQFISQVTGLAKRTFFDESRYPQE